MQVSNVEQSRPLRSQRGSLDADVHMLLNDAELEEYLGKSLKAAAHRYDVCVVLCYYFNFELTKSNLYFKVRGREPAVTHRTVCAAPLPGSTDLYDMQPNPADWTTGVPFCC